MIQYAYIPLAKAPELLNPESYGVRIPVYLKGYLLDIKDSNGNGIVNILELEGNPFTPEQVSNIEVLSGQVFANVDLYLAFKNSLIS